MTRKLRASPEAVLSFLHGDPERFFRLSPLIVSVAKNADPHSYTIAEEIPVLGLTTQTSFTAIVRLVEDGVEIDVVAGLGTRSKNAYHVRTSSEDGVTCELVEHTTTQGFFLVMWYIVRTQMNGHVLFMDKLQLALEGTRQTDDDNQL